MNTQPIDVQLYELDMERMYEDPAWNLDRANVALQLASQTIIEQHIEFVYNHMITRHETDNVY